MNRIALVCSLLVASFPAARASTPADFRLRPPMGPSFRFSDPGLRAGLVPPPGPALRLSSGSGGDAAPVSGLQGTGLVLLGGFANTLVMLPTLSFAGQSDTALGGSMALLSGVALWALATKGTAWLLDVDRSWGSAFAGAGLGFATGAALAVVLGLTVPDGPGFNKLAAGLAGLVFGGAVATPLWTLADPFGLTPPATDEAQVRRDSPGAGALSLPLAAAMF